MFGTRLGKLAFVSPDQSRSLFKVCKIDSANMVTKSVYLTTKNANTCNCLHEVQNLHRSGSAKMFKISFSGPMVCPFVPCAPSLIRRSEAVRGKVNIRRSKRAAP